MCVNEGADWLKLACQSRRGDRSIVSLQAGSQAAYSVFKLCLRTPLSRTIPIKMLTDTQRATKHFCIRPRSKGQLSPSKTVLVFISCLIYFLFSCALRVVCSYPISQAWHYQDRESFKT